MGLLPRKEQDILITSFERDYGKLIMECKNNNINKKSFEENLYKLLEQIESMVNTDYFEDDNIEFLNCMSQSIRIAA